MKFGPVPIELAEGKILGHNIAGLDGRRAFRKGRPLTAEDIAALQTIGRGLVYVAELEPGDVDEDRAARRVAQAVAGPRLRLSGPASGRVNFLAEVRGVLRVDSGRLAEINTLEGVTLATLTPHVAASARQIAATVKIIPYALPESVVRRAEGIASRGGPLLRLDAIQPKRVAIILSGSASVRDRVIRDFEPPLRERIEALGSTLHTVDFVSLEDEAGEAALAGALQSRMQGGAGLVILAGETAIMDRHDIAPRAIERAGGEVTCFGAPVDPGNLLLVGYLGQLPILGAPGCARSRKANVVDWVLPRLLAGDRLAQADMAALGAGGLLEEPPERPLPRALKLE